MTGREQTVSAPPRPSRPATPQRARRRRRGMALTWVYAGITVVVGVLVLLLAELSAHHEWIDTVIVPAPTSVWTALVNGFSTGLYWAQIGSTVEAAVIGFAISSAGAVLIAAVMSTFDPVRRIFFPYVIAFQTIPIIAVAPIVILWLGFGQPGKIAVVVVVVFFPVLINALHGFELRDRDALRLFESLGASRMQLFLRLRLPGALPFLFAGLRIGLQFSLIGAVVAEFLGSQNGLGFVLMTQKAAFDVPGEFAVLVILMIIGLALNGLLGLIERVAMPWSARLRAGDRE